MSGQSTNWLANARDWIRRSTVSPRGGPRIGLALGGGFARGIAHVGILRVFERHGVPIGSIAGVSAGSIVAAAYASGATPDEIEDVASAMRFRDIAQWRPSMMGLADSARMMTFLQRLLKVTQFQEMRIPLAVVATDLSTGQAAVFKERGDVTLPIRASCAYPGLFAPVRHQARYLVDGMVSMEVPAWPLRQMGATHVIAVGLPSPDAVDLQNMFSVVNRCFQILTSRTEREWRRHARLVITPEVGHVAWDSFTSCAELVQAGEKAALAAMPAIEKWLGAATASGGAVASGGWRVVSTD
jgi:NTE family protein